jgi:predicted acylesterase/phospholipase RssA
MSFPFRKLGLGGGGMKGVLHLGALRELGKHQDLYFPDGLYGTSIGAIIAVFVAFQIKFTDDFLDDKKEFLSIQNLIPDLNFETLQDSFPEKGIFTMDIFKEKVIRLFKKCDLDIETLKIKDAKMPLYIIASNITKGVPTIFTGDITIIDALRCSCCLPFVYRPQELYGQLYIDGDVFLPYIGCLEKDAFIITLKTHSYANITPKTIKDIDILSYIRQIYNMGVLNSYEFQKNDLTLNIVYPNLLAESDLNDFNILDIFRSAENDLRRFLITNGFLKEFSEVV